MAGFEDGGRNNVLPVESGGTGAIIDLDQFVAGTVDDNPGAA